MGKMPVTSENSVCLTDLFRKMVLQSTLRGESCVLMFDMFAYTGGTKAKFSTKAILNQKISSRTH